MITIPLRILLVEDNDTDALLIKRQLSRLVEDPHIEVVEDLEACRHQLVNFVPDLVISDFNLPTCTGMDVLRLSQEIDPQLPRILSLLKKVVLRMSSREEVRERIRQNKASVNQIRSYLESLNTPDMEERQANINRIKRDLEQLNLDEEE